MKRGVLLLALIGCAGLTWWWVSEQDSTHEARVALDPGEDMPPGAEITENAPTLVGNATETNSETAFARRPDGSHVIHALVVDERGKPVPDIPVQLIATRPTPRDGPTLSRIERVRRQLGAHITPTYVHAAARSGPDGTCVFPNIDGKGSYQLALDVNAPWMRTHVPVPNLRQAPDRDPMRLVYRQGRPITLRVVDQQGKGVRALIRAAAGPRPILPAGVPQPRLATQWTDANGRLTLPAVAGDSLHIVAQVTGVGTLVHQALLPAREEVVLTLAGTRPRVILGRVVETDGSPIPDAMVSVQMGNGPLLRFNSQHDVTTDSEGRYRIERAFGPAVVRMLVQATGYAPRSLDSSTLNFSGRDTLEADVILPRASSILTVVRDTHGVPLVGAHVMIAPDHTRGRGIGDQPETALTGEDGKATFESVAPGAWTVSAATQGYRPVAPMQLARVHLSPGQTSTLTAVVLTRAAALAGTILDPDGQPAAGVTLQVGFRGASGWSSFNTRASAKTDAAGAYIVDHLGATEPWFVRAHGPRGWLPATVVPPLKDGETTRLDLTLTRGVRVMGVVRTPTGETLANFPVNMYTARRIVTRGTHTDADGVFTFEDIPPGHVTVNAAGRRIRPSNAKQPPFDSLVSSVVRIVTLEAPPDPIDLTVLRLGRIQGTVVDSKGQPIAGAAVQLRSNLTASTRIRAVQTDIRGRFIFHDVHELPYTVAVAGVPPSEATPVGIDQAPLRLTAPEHGSPPLHAAPTKPRLVVRALMPNGGPVFNAICQVLHPGTGVLIARADVQDGRAIFSPRGKPWPNPIHIMVQNVRRADGQPSNVLAEPHTFSVPEEGTLELRLEAGGVIEGRVVLDSGERPRWLGGRVSISLAGKSHSAKARRQSISLGGDHTFSFRGLTPGRYVVHYEPQHDTKYLPTPAVTVESNTTDLEFRLEEGPSVSGHVEGPDGAALAGALVTYKAGVSGSTRAVRTDKHGAFEILGVDPNWKGTLSAKAPDAGGHAMRLEAELKDVLANSAGHRLRFIAAKSIRGTLKPARPDVSLPSTCYLRAYLTLPDGRVQNFAVTVRNGQFVLGGLPDGIYDLKLMIRHPLRGELKGVEAGSSEVTITVTDR